MKRDIQTYLKTHHRDRGITGMLSTVEDYERLKKEEIDWKPHIKSQITRIEIPFELFMRLMMMDKTIVDPANRLEELAFNYLEKLKTEETNDL